MSAPIEEPPHLRSLRRLVNVLTSVMIVGIVTIVIVIVVRFAQPLASPPTIPDNLSIPAAETTLAVTKGTGWVALVTVDGDGIERIRIFAGDGVPRQTVTIGGE